MTDTPITNECIKENKHIKFLEEDHWSLNGKFTYTHPIVSLCRKLERERDEARERADTMFAKHVDILDQTRNERDEWKAKYIQQNKELNVLVYWRDISECDCSNPLPNGGCLRCDLDRVFNSAENK